MGRETDTWTLVKAKYIGEKRTKPVRVIVIHTAENPESEHAAEDLAKYGQNPDYPSSWHITVDSNSIIQCVPDSMIAYAAPGVNSDGIQIELAGRAGQNASDWDDDFSVAMIKLASDAVAQYCVKYDVPPVHLTNAQLLAGEQGIIGHYQASEVYKKSDHMDPGPNFPWERFIALVATKVLLRNAS